jgi:hypothetical protein
MTQEQLRQPPDQHCCSRRLPRRRRSPGPPRIGRRGACWCVKGRLMPCSWSSSNAAAGVSWNRASTGYSFRGIGLVRLAPADERMRSQEPVESHVHWSSIATSRLRRTGPGRCIRRVRASLWRRQQRSLAPLAAPPRLQRSRTTRNRSAVGLLAGHATCPLLAMNCWKGLP